MIALVIALALAAEAGATPTSTSTATPTPTATSTATPNPDPSPTPGPSPTPTPNPPAPPETRFESANALYLSGHFDDAARAYRALHDEGRESPALQLNLGNALVRAGARGQGMAAYERALRLAPLDDDARANLELARAQNADRLVGAADPSLAERLVARTGDRLAVGLFGAAWAALWALLWLHGRATHRASQALAAASLLAALLALAGGALVAAKAADRRLPSAVVVVPAAPVREGPERALKAAFEVHEGTTLRVLEARGDQARVRLDNGLTGWVAAADLEII